MKNLTISVALTALAVCAGVSFAEDTPQHPGITHLCYDHIHPNSNILKPVECLFDDAVAKRDLKPSGTAPSVAPATATVPLATSTSVPQAFNFVFNCTGTGSGRADFCEKTQNAFTSSGQIISGVFDIKTTINVNVQIRPFCFQGVCSYGDQATQLGNAGPTRSIPLTSDDGQVRLYPQALVKQFGISGIQFTPYDIDANINSNTSISPARTYFRGDALPSPGENTHDIESTILHELLHGLGFLSMWRYTAQEGTALYMPAIQTNERDEAISFFEGAFDRYVTRTDDNSRLTAVTDSMNKVAFPGSTTQSLADLSWIEKNAQLMGQITPLGKLATTARSLAFTASAGMSRFLETGLTPWSPGSSGSHLDYQSYINSTDFLMIWSDKGVGTMSQQIADVNGLLSGNQLNDASALATIDSRMALGPGIRFIMQSMGWSARTNTASPSSTPASASAALPTNSESATLIGMPASITGAARRVVRFARAHHDEDVL